jgi:DNA-binding CsgD family transcriptional regulator
MSYVRARDSQIDAASPTGNGLNNRVVGIRAESRGIGLNRIARANGTSGHGASGGLAVLEGAPSAPSRGFVRLEDRSAGPAALNRPRQKAVRKTEPAGSQVSVRARHSDGASLQLMAHEVVFLRQEMKELTDRERDVAFAVCTGGSNERMAERLCIALPTLRTHLMRLNQKLGTVRKGDIVRMLASRLLQAYRAGELGAGAEPAVIDPVRADVDLSR